MMQRKLTEESDSADLFHFKSYTSIHSFATKILLTSVIDLFHFKTFQLPALLMRVIFRFFKFCDIKIYKANSSLLVP